MSSTTRTQIMALPAWNYDSWTRAVPKRTDSLKEQLLRQSLEMVTDYAGNEDVCRKVLEQALDAHLFDIAFEALRTFSPDSAFDLCISIGKLYGEMKYWRHITPSLTAYCEDRVLKARECRSGLGWGGHFCDQRSRALGLLGRYRFFTGDPASALRLWDAATDRQDVEEVLAEMCDTIARNSRERVGAAMLLLDLMTLRNIKAKTLAQLSTYA